MILNVSFLWWSGLVYLWILKNSCVFIAEWTICKCEGQGQAYGSGDGVAQDCVFPFKHNGKTYSSCATSSDGKGPYCATKVDSNGNLVKNQWARCNDYCDTEKGEIIVRIIV